jgi:hypothetical protein
MLCARRRRQSPISPCAFARATFSRSSDTGGGHGRISGPWSSASRRAKVTVFSRGVVHSSSVSFRRSVSAKRCVGASPFPRAGACCTSRRKTPRGARIRASAPCCAGWNWTPTTRPCGRPRGVVRHRGVGRVLLRQIASADLNKAAEAAPILAVWRCDNPGAVEAALIYHLRPRLNQTPVCCPVCSRPACSQAPDRSPLLIEVRSNAHRRPDRALCLLPDRVHSEASGSAEVPTTVPAGRLAGGAPPGARGGRRPQDHHGPLGVRLAASSHARGSSLADDRHMSREGT